MITCTSESMTAYTRANASSKKVSTAAGEQKSPPPAPPSKRPPDVTYLTLDDLRNSTLTSYDRCVTGFVKMMKVLADADPQLAGLSNELIRELLDNNPTVRRSVYGQTEDWKVLQKHSSFPLDPQSCSTNRRFCISAKILTPSLSAMLASHIATKDLIEHHLLIFNLDA
ncbi:hypothetical protein Aperf_G00000026351 [Anoplocephala perfoliata]